MSSYSDQASAAAALQNPALTGQDLMDIAYAYPALGAAVARHPAVYPGLLDWLKQYGSPDAQAAASGQSVGVIPTPAPVVASVASSVDWPSASPVIDSPVSVFPAAASPAADVPASPDYSVLASTPIDSPAFAAATPDPRPAFSNAPVPPPRATINPSAPANPQPTYYAPAANAVPDAPSGGFAFLGFLIPLVGLILFLVWKDQTPLKARSAGKGALIGVIVGFVFLIIYFIFIAVLINSYS